MTRRVASPSRRTPGQWGTVEQLPSGRWRASYRREGRKFSAPHTFATKTDAGAWLASEHADRARGTWRDPNAGKITLATYATDWLATRPDLQPRTRDLYQRTLNRWILPRVAPAGSRGVELGAMDVADLTPAVIRTWYAAALTAGRESAIARKSGDLSRQSHPARAWALSRGMDVSTTGKPSGALLDAWRAAGEPHVGSTRAVGDNVGETAAANAYRILRTLLGVAVTDGLLTVNPCQIKGAGQIRARERGTATPDEVTRLAAHMPRRFAAAVTLAAWSGLRYGELFALARKHIDLDTGTVRVTRALEQVSGQPLTFGRTKTPKSRRTVNLPQFVVDALAAHLAEHVAASPDALVFTLENGSPVTSNRLAAMFGKARAVINRSDLTWHDLRHTGASLAYRAGASVPDVQRRLGHTTMRAAQLYAHAVDDSDRVLADRLDEMYGTPTTINPRPLRAV